MSFAGSVRVATRTGFTAMRANPVRAALATLGVIIGSGALVSVLAVSDGVEKYARDRVSRQGFDRITIRGLTDDVIDGQVVPRANPASVGPADLRDVAAILQPTEHAILNRVGVTLSTIGGRQRAVVARGVMLSAPDSLGQSLIAGRALTPDETVAGAAVAVVNLPLARALVGDSARAAERALSDSIVIGGKVLRVVGVVAAEEASGPLASALTLFGPLSLTQAAYAPARGAPAAPGLTITTTQAENVRAMRSRVEAWLTARDAHWRDRYRIEARAESQLLDLQRGMLIFRLLMGSITGITLIVGGIGIMNVLLASVAERTREIGIRKAVGARKRDILLQFLAESVTITGVGSALGTAFGLGAAYAVTAVMRSQTQAIIYAATTAQTLAISALMAVLVGVAFGCYPALRAARLAPIDAIHTE